MAKFTCGLCKKEVKRGNKFGVDLTEWTEETRGEVYDGYDEICQSCAKKICKKLDSMLK